MLCCYEQDEMFELPMISHVTKKVLEASAPAECDSTEYCISTLRDERERWER